MFMFRSKTVFYYSQNIVGVFKMYFLKGSSGSEFDVQCSRSTEMSVTESFEFMFKEPTLSGKKTVAEVKAMAPRQEVTILVSLILHYVII